MVPQPVGARQAARREQPHTTVELAEQPQQPVRQLQYLAALVALQAMRSHSMVTPLPGSAAMMGQAGHM